MRGRENNIHKHSSRHLAGYHVFTKQSMVCVESLKFFVITAKVEPSLRIPCSRGLFKVAEGDAGCVGRPGTRPMQQTWREDRMGAGADAIWMRHNNWGSCMVVGPTDWC
jgi:hypothetical protein